MQSVEYYTLPISKKKLSNLVDSVKQDHYSRREYFCGQKYKYIINLTLNIMLYLINLRLRYR